MALESHRVPSFPKINLGLEVLGLRQDGYHELRTIFQTLALKDDITLCRKQRLVEPLAGLLVRDGEGQFERLAGHGARLRPMRAAQCSDALPGEPFSIYFAFSSSTRRPVPSCPDT